MTNYYRGWTISEYQGHYFAKRHGVGMNSNSLEGIKSMIDQKIWLQSQPNYWTGP